jgi:rfaE bifunctional protein nucleotidyltransferase chain/domain
VGAVRAALGGRNLKTPVQRKIVPPGVLAERLRAERAAGRTVVQCHGCFDIVHPGHVRYLQGARQLGNVLVVSLTGDRQVDKGFDRPYIPQELRAENLAALEFVDWVVIDPHPTACELLDLLKPDIYVKGREYADAADPRFLQERERVESYGGRVVFHSGDVVFSSTRLAESLGREELLETYRLRALCQRNGLDLGRVQRTLRGLRGMSAVVVGDALQDHYVTCDARETAGDAPIPAFHQLGMRSAWGGAAAVALQLRSLGAEVLLVTAGGKDAATRELAALCARQDIECELPPLREALVQRTTFLADETKLLRVHAGAPAALDSAMQRRLRDRLRARVAGAGLLVWCDHGHGMVVPELVSALTEAAARGAALTAGAAPGARGSLVSLRGADLLSMTERQLREAMHDMSSGMSSVAWRLLNQTGGQTALISVHKRGLIGFDGRGALPEASPGAAPKRVRTSSPDRLRGEFVPLFTRAFVDLLGQDETVLAAASLVMASGAPLALATYVACAAASRAAGRSLGAPVSLIELEDWAAQRPELRDGGSRFMVDTLAPADRSHESPHAARRAEAVVAP